ncbi:hypothetical protein D9756_010711 [Leucocoprinus leucothites]|uniref:Uncharacterized protein n=1 Tax=Leucocoprinus leucothites TaxID=201217 RepID=A0A8H5CV53_9AGAR|nr:hypothetical protein D9756_010711 [Leucoagaricus leucothites]
MAMLRKDSRSQASEKLSSSKPQPQGCGKTLMHRFIVYVSPTFPSFRLITYILAAMDGSRKPSVLIETSVELIKQVEDLIQNLDLIAGFPWEISSLDKDHWMVIDKFLQAGFGVCVASLEMSHQIVEHFSSPGRAISEDNPRSTLDIRVTDDMMSMATAFNSALLELHEGGRPHIWHTAVCKLAHVVDQLPFNVNPTSDERYRIRSSCPLQTATSLINASHSLDKSWRIAILPGNSDILESVREELVNIFREHTIRVQASASELRKYCWGVVSSPASLDGLSTRNLWNGEEEYSPDAQYAVGLLESYLSNPPWRYHSLDDLFDADAIYGLNHIQSSPLIVLIHDTPSKISSVASMYLRFLDQMRVSCSSMLEIENRLHHIQTAGCYDLLQDPASTLGFMVLHREIIQSAVEEARATAGSLLSYLDELRQHPDIKCQGVPDGSQGAQSIPVLTKQLLAHTIGFSLGEIPCTKCIFDTLYDHCELILGEVLGESQLFWVTSLPAQTGTRNLFPVVRMLVKEPRKRRIDFFKRLLDEDFPPVAISHSSDIQDQVIVWSYLVSRVHMHTNKHFVSAISSWRVWHWRPCKAKEQAEFAENSRKSRMRYERAKMGLKDENVGFSVKDLMQFGAQSRKGRGKDEPDWSF